MTANYAGEYLRSQRIENRHDARRFVERLTNDRTPDRYEWWLLIVGSMSPSSRKAVLDDIAAADLTVSKYRRRHRKARAAAQKDPSPAPWWKRLGFIAYLPLALPVLLISKLARLVGRGPRAYLLHAPVIPPDQDPPGGAHVREPRRPSPNGGSRSVRLRDS